MAQRPADRHRTTGLASVVLAFLALTGCGPASDAGSADRPTRPVGEPPASSASTAPGQPAGPPTSPSVPSSAPTTVPSPPPTATPGKRPTINRDTPLKPGMSGPLVLAAQRRLSDLGYWLGGPDSEYGGQTSQAVMALQKAAGLSRDGVLGPKTQAALTRGVRPRPRTTAGSAIEIDKTRQIMLVVVDGRLRYTLNTSTGSGRPYTSGEHTYLASTPSGRFTVQRQIDGLRVSHLGELWRPKYFSGGYALHGSPNVPGYPASHGCVRLANPSINLLWSAGLAPVGRTVWIY